MASSEAVAPDETVVLPGQFSFKHVAPDGEVYIVPIEGIHADKPRRALLTRHPHALTAVTVVSPPPCRQCGLVPGKSVLAAGAEMWACGAGENGCGYVLCTPCAKTVLPTVRISHHTHQLSGGALFPPNLLPGDVAPPRVCSVCAASVADATVGWTCTVCPDVLVCDACVLHDPMTASIPVEGLAVKGVTWNHAEISWKPREGARFYRVRLTRTATNELVEDDIISAAESNFNKLSPRTGYTVRVEEWPALRDDVAPAIVTFETVRNTPVVNGLNATMVTATSVTIKWNKPHPSHHVTSYLVVCAPAHPRLASPTRALTTNNDDSEETTNTTGEVESAVRNVTVGGADTEAIVEGLAPESSYTVTVAPWDEEVQGTHAILQGSNAVTTKPLPPMNLRCTVIDHRVVLQWDVLHPETILYTHWLAQKESIDKGVLPSMIAPPPHSGAITDDVDGPNYFRVSVGSSTSVNDFYTTCPVLLFRQQQLTHGVTYFITVASRNKAGWSEISPPFLYTIPPTHPPAVTDVRLTADSTKVALTWTRILPEAAGGSPVTEYRVYYAPWIEGEDAVNEDERRGSRCLTVRGGAASAAVTKLRPATEYVFTVAAVNAVGRGPVSNIVKQYTLPDAPINLSALSLNPTTVFLLWETSSAGTGGKGKAALYGEGDDATSSAGGASKAVVGGGQPTVFRIEWQSSLGYEGACESTSNKTVIGGLQPSATYTFVVSGMSHAGTGDKSAPLRFTAAQGRPSVPGRLTFGRVTGSSMCVNWTPPLCEGAEGLRYTLAWQQCDVKNAKEDEQAALKIGDGGFIGANLATGALEDAYLQRFRTFPRIDQRLRTVEDLLIDTIRCNSLNSMSRPQRERAVAVFYNGFGKVQIAGSKTARVLQQDFNNSPPDLKLDLSSLSAKGLRRALDCAMLLLRPTEGLWSTVLSQLLHRKVSDITDLQDKEAVGIIKAYAQLQGFQDGVDDAFKQVFPDLLHQIYSGAIAMYSPITTSDSPAPSPSTTPTAAAVDASLAAPKPIEVVKPPRVASFLWAENLLDYECRQAPPSSLLAEVNSEATTTTTTDTPATGETTTPLGVVSGENSSVVKEKTERIERLSMKGQMLRHWPRLPRVDYGLRSQPPHLVKQVGIQMTDNGTRAIRDFILFRGGVPIAAVNPMYWSADAINLCDSFPLLPEHKGDFQISNTGTFTIRFDQYTLIDGFGYVSAGVSGLDPTQIRLHLTTTTGATFAHVHVPPPTMREAFSGIIPLHAEAMIPANERSSKAPGPVKTSLTTCSFMQHGFKELDDIYFLCLTCGISAGHAICLNCRMHCHTGHEVVERRGAYYCDCPRLAHECTLVPPNARGLDIPFRLSETDATKYTQAHFHVTNCRSAWNNFNSLHISGLRFEADGMEIAPSSTTTMAVTSRVEDGDRNLRSHLGTRMTVMFYPPTRLTGYIITTAANDIDCDPCSWTITAVPAGKNPSDETTWVTLDQRVMYQLPVARSTKQEFKFASTRGKPDVSLVGPRNELVVDPRSSELIRERPFALVRGLTPGALYSFSLRCTNSLAEPSEAVTAVYGTLPLPPQAITATGGTAELNVAWTVAEGHCDCLFEVYCKEVTEADNGFQLKRSTSDRTATIKDLFHGTTYAIKVRTINRAGPSADSEIVIASTLPGCPKAPREVEIVSEDVATVTLRWQPPLKDGGAPVTGYVLSRQNTNERMETIDRTFTYTRLSCNTQYHFEICAVNVAGEGEKFTFIHRTMRGPPDAPVNIRRHEVVPAEVTTLSIAWDAPPSTDGQRILEYKVFRRRSDDGPFDTSMVVPGDRLECKMFRLPANTRFWVKIKTKTAAGESNDSEVVALSTPRGHNFGRMMASGTCGVCREDVGYFGGAQRCGACGFVMHAKCAPEVEAACGYS